LRRQIEDARERGLPYIDMKVGRLHRLVGGYPGHNHRMPIACREMRAAMRPGDTIISSPPQGQGATLTIRYVLDAADRY